MDGWLFGWLVGLVWFGSGAVFHIRNRRRRASSKMIGRNVSILTRKSST